MTGPRPVGAVGAVGVLGTGSYLPKEEVDNAEVAARTRVPEAWIVRRTRIRTRRRAAPDEATSDLAARAAEAALDDAGLDPTDVDHLVLSTSTGDSPQPPTSLLVQRIIGARRAACLDLNVACSGFVYGLAIAHALVLARPDRRVLVVAADLYSRFVDDRDRALAVLAGDGAGAAVVGAGAASSGFLDFSLIGRGEAHELVRVEAGGSRLPASHDTVDAGAHQVRMVGHAVRDFVLQEVPPVLTALLADHGLTRADVDHFVPHQPNGVLLRELAETAGLDRARLHSTVERYGNMGSASLPVTLDEAHRSGALSAGDLVLLAGFGGGMAVGAGLLRWGAA